MEGTAPTRHQLHQGPLAQERRKGARTLSGKAMPRILSSPGASCGMSGSGKDVASRSW
jgi:hypothetical protein